MKRSSWFPAAVSLLALAGCPYSFTADDAGDAAWVEQAVPAVLGRKPINALETKVLVDIVEADGRAAALDVLMSLPEFDTYWSLVLADALKTQRSGVGQAAASCFSYSAYLTPASAAPDIADALSTQTSATASAGLPSFTFADVLRSSIAADDAFAPWRFSPFVLEHQTRTWDGVGRDVFLQSHAHRSVSCIECHNSTSSSSDIAPVPLDLDTALFDNQYGVADNVRFLFGEDAASGGTLSLFGSAVTTCASVAGVMSVDAHGAGVGTEFAGLNPTDPGNDCAWDQAGHACESLDILDLDAAIFAGRSAATASLVSADLSTPQTPSAGHSYGSVPTGDEALGAAIALAIAEAMVKEVEGHGLTLPHGHPRVDEQRSYLQGYATWLITSGWSLRVPLKTMVLSGTFNMKPPSQTSSDYPFPMFFNPWAKDDAPSDVYDNVNGVGDLVHRFSVPAMLGKVQHSLGWNAPQLNPSGTYPTKEFQRQLGRYESYEEQGFDDVTFQSLLLWEDVVGECINPTGGTDWVDYVVTEANNNPAYTLQDVIIAMKDRFIQESSISDGSVVYNPDDDVVKAGVSGGVDWDDIDEVEAWAQDEASLADTRDAQREKARAITRQLEAEIAEGEAQMAADTAANAKEDPEAWRERYDAYTEWLDDAGWTKTWAAYGDRVDEEGAFLLLTQYGDTASLWGPIVYDTEADKLADYFGVTSLGVSASTVPHLEDLLRGYCGVLTTTPQFLLGGMRRAQTAPDPVPDLLVCLPTQATWCDEHNLCTLYNGYLAASGNATITCP